MSIRITQSENVQLIEQYLTDNYELRFNVLSNKIEIRKRKDGEIFVPLTEKKRNSMIRQIKLDLEEVTSVKQNVQEYLDSDDIQQYDPICDWLHGLPAWDGQNRVSELFNRIPGISSEQIYWCTIWMRSAVAHWLDLDTLHGNECVPVLIGEQGCGKSTFCQRMLPPHLREYFLDHINLANKNDKEMALTNNLLINIDEIDQIRQSRQPELKQPLSKVKINGRPIYGREQHDRKRFASFVATTNNPHPLQDPTGSRRYLCIRIPNGMQINNESAIDYEQIYAQLVEEVTTAKARYWFNNEETKQIQQFNCQFQQEQDICTMLDNCFRKAKEGEGVSMLPVKTIINMLEKQYPQVKKTHAFSVLVGTKLKSMGFKHGIHNGASSYNAVPKHQSMFP